MENSDEKKAQEEAMDIKKWLSATKAARYLDMNIKTFRNYVSRGVIPFHMNPVTGTRRYFIPDLDEWMGKS